AKRVSIAADYVLPALSNAALSFDYEDGEETADAGFQLGAKKLVLKRLSGYVPIDNRVLTLNSDGSLENAIVASLYKIADAKKAADLFTNDLSGVTEITVGTTNYEKIVGLEAELLAKGIDGASLVYVYHPSMLPKLKANEKKVNGITEPILKDGMIGGIKAVVTTACPADKIYLMAGTEVWDNTAAFTLSLDENTLSHKGQSRIVCNIYTDEKISRNEFAAFTTLA
ncbi:hypothetical protein LJC54_00205, partial [Parabacteroides sp. OttesenSCG-928-J18]|nr:hypothetical protein [Parabacteroides sp. OttesenSCG-928-J18]